MPYTADQVMLTLAGLAYRGFHDLLRGGSHTDVVRAAVLDGLRTLPPVKDQWTLVWGPVTSRSGPDAFDSAAMYVVQSRREPTRYVVAIRGTNPISASDWLFGDFWVSTTVPWPYARGDGDAAISASTALGLSKLQTMRSPRVALDPAVAARRPAAARNALEDQIDRIASAWERFAQAPTAWAQDHLNRLRSAVTLPWMDLRFRSAPAAPDETGLDLLSLLAAEARAAAGPLDVVVTGHSKGGALASALALWLKELLGSADTGRWDGGRGARVACHAFASPTPGNAGFADRIDAMLGPDHHHLRNSKDVVPHAWQADELEEIPELYAPRRTALRALIPVIAVRVAPLGYRHARAGLATFAGGLDRRRAFEAEFVHQHLEAYLAELRLLDQQVTASALFF